MYKRKGMIFIAVALFVLTASSVRGQNDMPQMDKKGNWQMSFGPVESKVKYGGAAWRVVSRKLPIRKGPSTKTKILSTLKKGDVIAAFIGRGGSDEVLINTKANNGWTWMRVVTVPGDPEQFGYVRANARFIRPLLPPNVAEAPLQIEADGSDDEESGDAPGGQPAAAAAPVKGSELAGVPGVAQLPAGTAPGQVIDKVVFNDAASEQKHKVNGKNTDSGDVDGRGYRGAVEGGQFSFQLAGKPGQTVDLVLTYNGDDEGSTFNVLVDGTVIAKQVLKKNEAGQFFDIRYRLAPNVTKNGTFTVTLQALPPKNIAGGCFGARTETVK